MNWKPTRGQKPDLPDNQIVQVIDNRGITYEIRVGAMDDTEAFYRESPVLNDDNDFTRIINNQRPKGLHDKDEIEVIDENGFSIIWKVETYNWVYTPARLLFYRLTKKYEEPKPKRVGELMTYDEWLNSSKYVRHDVRSACEYVDYIEENIKNDR